MLTLPLSTAADWHALYEAADRAGKTDALSAVPVPMIVCDAEPFGDLVPSLVGRPIISEGLCGGACIRTDAEHAFSQWLRSEGLGVAGPDGMELSARSDGQSIGRAKAYANAFASVRRLHGIDCVVRTYLS